MSRKLAEKRLQRLRQEVGTVEKAWGDRVSVALVYPNTYFVGMSNLGYQLVYRLLNQRDDVVCERAFLPDGEDLPAYEESGRRITSLEGDRPLGDFDIVAFSVPFENDYPNILKILSLSSIPLLSSERDENIPLVISGGVTSSLNPEPLAGFIDLFAVGEGEVIVPSLVESYKRSRDSGREGLLLSLSQEGGIYVPSLYETGYNADGTVSSCRPIKGAPLGVRRRWLSEEEVGEIHGGSSILTEETEFGDMYLSEVGRGCERGCRFCAAGFIYLPPRERKIADLKSEFDEGISKSKRIGLISPSLADHPDIEGICAAISEAGGRSSLSSVRADALREGYLKYVKESGQRTVTIAPEAGTERLRDVINKGLSDSDILNAVGMLADAGIPNVRFYFMTGLPTETDNDIEGIIDISIRCRDLFLEKSRVHGRVGRIILSVNSFVPKPFTPFQWHPMEDERSLKEKLKRIKKALAGESNINVNSDLPKWSHIEGLLSRGDRRIGKVILAVHENGGDWRRALKDTGITPEFYTTRQRGKDEIFPWEVLDLGLKRDYLWKEYRRGLEGKTTPPCNIGSCTRCGVC